MDDVDGRKRPLKRRNDALWQRIDLPSRRARARTRRNVSLQRRTGATVVAALLWAAGIATTGCAPDTQAPAAGESMPTAPDGQALRPAPLPDLSEMTPAVQDQIRERHASLRAAIERPAPNRELSEAYGAMGNVLMAARYADAPEPFYLNAQTLAPGDRRWPYYLGHLYTTQGAYESARTAFERALELQADDVPALVSLGEVHLAAGRPEAAEPLFTRALALRPDSVWAQISLGRAALARQDYALAVQHLEQALAADPGAAGIHYPLGMAHRGLGDMEEAESHLQLQGSGTVRRPDPLMQAMRASLRSPSAYEREGIQALGAGDWEAAVAAFRRGIELAPENPSLRHRLGTALYMMGDERGGRTQFEEALRVSPDHAEAHYSLGLILEGNGRIEEALHRFSTAVRHEPSYVEARSRLARLLRLVGRPNEALSEYSRVTAANPQDAEASFGYAMTLALLGRYQEARERLEEGVAAHPDQAIFAKALARLLAAAPDARTRDGQRALRLVEELLARERSFDLGEAMAMALAEVGRYDEAAGWQREVISMAVQAGRHDLAQLMAGNLRLYERGEPSRTPWRDDEMP
jgi:tetratricopeptide (TPR) repeat protein